MKTQYAGIDYGMGQTNRSKASGIRYGVINQNEVLEAWADSSEADYGDPACPKCGGSVKASRGNQDKDYYCQHCKTTYFTDSVWSDSPLGFTLDDAKYKAECRGDGDIFILESPYFTYAQFCSPCAPGACYLMNALEEPNENNKCYCFGHDWFEGNRAPYPVMSVKTGLPVQPE